MFSIQNISKFFKQGNVTSHIFQNISCSLSKGYSYAITGSSGIGKSTLIHMLAGIEEPSSGSILLNEQPLSKLPLEKKITLLQQKIGIVFQQPLLVSELSVIENIMLKSIILGTVQQNSKDYALQLLQEVNLVDKAYNKPSSLSGGQQQRIALLRAIFNCPDFLLADEPTGNLDETTGSHIIQLLLHYKKIYNMGLIISTHDMHIAHQMDYIIKIENKNLVLEKNKRT